MSSISANQHYFIIASSTPGAVAYNRPRIVRCPSSVGANRKFLLDFDTPQDPNDVVTFGPFEAIDAATKAQCSVMTSTPMTFRALYSEWAVKMLTNNDYKITSIYSYPGYSENVRAVRAGSMYVNENNGTDTLTLTINETSDENDWSTPTSSEHTFDIEASGGEVTFYRWTTPGLHIYADRTPK